MPHAAQDIDPHHPRGPRDWSGRFLALLSLGVALAGLGYNTWRNETTEAHRNARQAAFVVLDQAAQLQQIIDTRAYGGDGGEATRIAAWGKAGLLRDLGPLVSEASGRRAEAMFATWSAQAGAIDRHDTDAAEAVNAALQRLRRQTLADLRRLR
jgi:hypothetical protein